MKILSVRLLPPQPSRKDISDLGDLHFRRRSLTFIRDSKLSSLGLKIGWKLHQSTSFDYYLYSDGKCVGNYLFEDFDPNGECKDIQGLFKSHTTLVSPHSWLDKRVQRLGVSSYVYKIALASNLCLVATEQTHQAAKLWASLASDLKYTKLDFDTTSSSVVTKARPYTWALLCRKALLA